MWLTCHCSGQLWYRLNVNFCETGSGNGSTVEFGGGGVGEASSAQSTSLYALYEHTYSQSTLHLRYIMCYAPLCSSGPVVILCHILLHPLNTN